MATGSAPIPNGVTASFAGVKPNTNTATFTMSAGVVVITFQPADVNDPGVMSLYNSSDVLQLTMSAIGHTAHQVPSPSASYYFSTTKGAAIVAMTLPNDGVR